MFAQDARTRNADPGERRASFPTLSDCNGWFDSKRDAPPTPPRSGDASLNGSCAAVDDDRGPPILKRATKLETAFIEPEPVRERAAIKVSAIERAIGLRAIGDAGTGDAEPRPQPASAPTGLHAANHPGPTTCNRRLACPSATSAERSRLLSNVLVFSGEQPRERSDRGDRPPATTG
jgi:hypothetical protein